MFARTIVSRLKKAAAIAIAEGDPWSKHEIDKVPAERVIRHMYQPETQTWKKDETIVKIEKISFTNGAMRFCYRMKKRSPPPQSASNHRFHDYGWTRASNFVAKAYHDENGEIDTSEKAKENVRNDILLQYEASHWSTRFNDYDPPKKIIFIRAYAIEFPDREGNPWFAVERYIFGNDMYGAGFTKHNTNAGFVDEDLHRITPQVFSAHSFYQSQGNRLVVDIQGVGNLFTDPQVLSSDYRFGDGDLGPRGMALFFHTFRHNTVASAMGIPFFPLSKTELNHQSNYENFFFPLPGDCLSSAEAAKSLNRFEAIDLNRSRRKAVLNIPLKESLPDDMKDTEKRSNQAENADLRQRTQKSSKESIKKMSLKRTKSEMDEVQMCLGIAKNDFEFDPRSFLQKDTGELMLEMKESKKISKRSSFLIRRVSEPMIVSDSTMLNLGRVHYQLAVLHGMGRFQEDVAFNNSEDAPSHDVFSVLFHLSHAASLHCVPACLSLGRILAGLGTCVSDLLDSLVPIDFEAAKLLLNRALESKNPPNAPKVAAGCVLYQIYSDEAFVDRGGIQRGNDSGEKDDQSSTDLVLINLLEKILDLMVSCVDEAKTNLEFKERAKSSSYAFRVGDKVEGNYFLEGNYYPGIVESSTNNGTIINVKYDDDGTIESLPSEHVRLRIPPTATQTSLGGPLTDEEAGFEEFSDETITIETHKLRSDLAKMVENSGDKLKASKLYEAAAHEAMQANKMKLATVWSLKAADILQ